MIAQDPVLEVRDLRTYFHTEEGVARAVDGVSFAVGRGQTLGSGRRKRLRQERQRLFDHALGARSTGPH